MPKEKRGRQSTLFEKFYTPPELALELVTDLQNRINLNKFETIVDCSSGPNARFLNAILEVVDHTNVVGYNVRLSENEKPSKAISLVKDLLELRTPKLNPKKTLVVSNVPFGRNGRTAAKYIQKASEFADHLAFILPKSFLKPSFLRRFVPSNLHMVYSKKLHNCKFLDRNDEEETEDDCECRNCQKKRNKFVTATCAFIYFQKRKYPCIYEKRKTVTGNPSVKLLDKSVVKSRFKADVRVCWEML